MQPPTPKLIPPQTFAAIALVVALAGCQPGSNGHPVPSVPQIGGDLKCTQGDHGYEDLQAGWGFCYPGTWKYSERSQATSSPPGLDLTFDVTDVPCASPAPGQGGAPPCSTNAGNFGFMIISTYERGNTPDLASWIQTNIPKADPGQAITWGNAVEAVQLPDGRRIALTPHHIVIMDLHSGILNLEGQMSSRLNTWKFTF